MIRKISFERPCHRKVSNDVSNEGSPKFAPCSQPRSQALSPLAPMGKEKEPGNEVALFWQYNYATEKGVKSFLTLTTFVIDIFFI